MWIVNVDRPFNLQGGGGGYGFLFRSELEYFFLSRKREIFFQNWTLGYMTKTRNQIIFFSNIGNQNIFSEKNHNPSPLQVKWSFPKWSVNTSTFIEQRFVLRGF